MKFRISKRLLDTLELYSKCGVYFKYTEGVNIEKVAMAQFFEFILKDSRNSKKSFSSFSTTFN